MGLLCYCFAALMISATLSQQIVFPFPSSITVPRGGCVNNAIGLSGIQSNLTLTIAPGASDADVTVSNRQVVFTPSQSNASITFCASSTTNLASVPLNLSLSGPDSSRYVLSTPTGLMNIVSGGNVVATSPSVFNSNGQLTSFPTVVPVMTPGINTNNLNTLLNGPQGISPNNQVTSVSQTTTTTGSIPTSSINSLIPGLVSPNTALNPNQQTTFNQGSPTGFFGNINAPPTISVQPLGNPGSDRAQFTIYTNNYGTIYYIVETAQTQAIPVSVTTTSMNFTSIKTSALSGVYIQQSPTELMRTLYVTDRDVRVGAVNTTYGSTTLSVSGLSPAKVYSFCAFFEISTGAVGGPSCLTFTTSAIATQRANFLFSRAIQAFEMNRFLCFLTTSASVAPQSIVTMLGDSCNPTGNTPINNNYRFIGTTMYPVRQMIVFFVTTEQLQSNNFVNLFESNVLNAVLRQQVRSAAESNGLAITSGVFLSDANLVNLQSPSNVPNAVLQSAVNTRDGKIVIPSASTPSPAVVYLIQVPTNSPRPTAEQILNCRNANNEQVSLCNRIALFGNEAAPITLLGAASHESYVLYYVATTPYPYRPITNGNVNSVAAPLSASNINPYPRPTKSEELPFVMLLLALLATLVL